MVPEADYADARADAASWRRVAERLEREKQHLAAALEHAVRDPAIASHAGWRADAAKALAFRETGDTK